MFYKIAYRHATTDNRFKQKFRVNLIFNGLMKLITITIPQIFAKHTGVHLQIAKYYVAGHNTTRGMNQFSKRNYKCNVNGIIRLHCQKKHATV